MTNDNKQARGNGGKRIVTAGVGLVAAALMLVGCSDDKSSRGTG